MTTTYGSAEGHLQVGINCWTSTPSASSTFVTVYLRVYVRIPDNWNFDDNQNYSVSGTGGGSGSFNNTLSGAGATKLIYSKDFNSAIDYDGGPTYTWTASISGMYNGGTPSHSRSMTLPRRPASVPAQMATPTVSGVTATGCSVSFSVPANNGASIAAYAIQVSPNSSFTAIDYSSTSIVSTPVAVSGLRKGTAYWVRMQARNSVGWGAWSGSRAFTTLTTAPGAPGTPSLSGANSSGVAVSWSPPSDDGGADITEYQVQRATDSAFSQGLSTTTLTQVALQVTGLQPGIRYWFRVRATNATGSSPYSASANFTTHAVAPGSPPMPVLNNILATELTVFYAAPSIDGGSEITGYEIHWARDSSFTGAGGTAADDASPYTVTGLLPGKLTYVRVRALNAVGAGAWSPAAFTTTLSGVKVGDGSQWRDAIVRIGNGSQWVLASIKRGSEAGWV